MKVKTISVKYGRRFNLDDWESIDLEVFAFGELGEGDDAKACYAELWNEAKDQVKAQALPALVKREEKRRMGLREVIDGLPKPLRAIASGLLNSAFNDVSVPRELPEAEEEKAA